MHITTSFRFWFERTKETCGPPDRQFICAQSTSVSWSPERDWSSNALNRNRRDTSNQSDSFIPHLFLKHSNDQGKLDICKARHICTYASHPCIHSRTTPPHRTAGEAFLGSSSCGRSYRVLLPALGTLNCDRYSHTQWPCMRCFSETKCFCLRRHLLSASGHSIQVRVDSKQACSKGNHYQYC